MRIIWLLNIKNYLYPNRKLPSSTTTHQIYTHTTMACVCVLSLVFSCSSSKSKTKRKTLLNGLTPLENHVQTQRITSTQTHTHTRSLNMHMENVKCAESFTKLFHLSSIKTVKMDTKRTIYYLSIRIYVCRHTIHPLCAQQCLFWWGAQRNSI